MAFPRSIRALVPLVIGLVVGGVGATLFRESMPGSEGSPEERANKLEAELKQATNRIAALEATKSEEHEPQGVLGRIAGGSRSGSKDRRRTLADGARRIAEDIREGRPVNPDDIFRASQPLMRDLAPLFDRIRVKAQQQAIEGMTGELTRKYHLTPQGQEALKQWFEEQSNKTAQQWSEMVARDGTCLKDVIRASHDVRLDEGLDAFMPSLLSGDNLAAFQTERMAERVQRVQQEADTKVERLDAIVSLDAAQKDQIFGIMARGSRDYDPSMPLDGSLGPIGPTPGGDRHEAMLSVLNPDQRAAYEAETLRRREKAAKDMAAVGLTLPPNWEFLDEDFR
jgi:hypothetical protein